jgi:hypothetical protein
MIHKHNCNPPRYEAELLSALSYTRAFETETVWVLCNAGGPADEGYIGCSGVWMPLKGKLGGCEGTESSLAIVEVDLDVLKVGQTPLASLISRTLEASTGSKRTTTRDLSHDHASCFSPYRSKEPILIQTRVLP